MRALGLLAVVLCGGGCARETFPAAAPQAGHAPGSLHAFAAPPPGAVPLSAQPHYAALAAPPMAGVVAPAALPPPPMSRPDVPQLSSSEIPSGDACLAELARTSVTHHRLEAKRGITTPVEVTGKIGGIHFGSPLVADCRFVLALHRVAPVMADLGVSAVRFSGAYSYRMSRVGRLSLHAYGLALDVHEIRFGTAWHSVEREFSRGLADGCAPTSPPMNQLACRLKATRLFKELLTPDYDSDHANHLHLAIAPTDTPKWEEVPKKRPAAPVKLELPPPAPDEGEPTVEPEEPPPPRLEPKTAKTKPKAKPKATKPAKHRPRAHRPRPLAS